MPGDSITNDATGIHAHLVAKSFESKLCAFDTTLAPPGTYGRVDIRRFDRARDVAVVHIREPNQAYAMFEKWRGPLVIRDHGAWWTSGRATAASSGQSVWRKHEESIRKTYARADLVLCVSTSTAARAVDLGARSVLVVPPVFPSNEFTESPFPAEIDWPSVLVVGRIESHSGVGRAVSSFHLFASMHCPQAQIAFLGRAKEAWYFNAVNESICLHRLSARLLGHVSHVELLSEYQRATSSLILSEASGFGTRIAESMLTGVPVVAIDSGVGAVAETVGDAGLLLSKDDDDGVVAEALAEVTNNFALRSTLRQRGFERAQQLVSEVTVPNVLAAIRPFTDA